MKYVTKTCEVCGETSQYWPSAKKCRKGACRGKLSLVRGNTEEPNPSRINKGDGNAKGLNQAGKEVGAADIPRCIVPGCTNVVYNRCSVCGSEVCKEHWSSSRDKNLMCRACQHPHTWNRYILEALKRLVTR